MSGSKWSDAVTPDAAPPRRLPGVRFEVPPPALDETLPRMDIAFFVGFAARGPLGAAVAVESLAEFEAVFGAGLVLARDRKTGERLGGLLHPAVRGFFSQRSEEHTSELQSLRHLVCRLLLEKK